MLKTVSPAQISKSSVQSLKKTRPKLQVYQSCLTIPHFTLTRSGYLPVSLPISSNSSRFAAMLCLIFFLLSGKSVVAQVTPINTLDVNAIYIPESKYKQRDGNIENTKKVQQRIDMGYSFLIATKVDTATRKSNRWTGMINSSFTQFSGKTNEKDAMPNQLLSVQSGVSYLHTMRNKWMMMNLLTLGVNSDLKNLDFHDLYINGGVLFIKNYSPAFSFGFGGFVINALNTPILLPGIFLNLRTEGKYKFTINLPTEVSATYDLTKKMELKLAFKLRNMSYDTENTVDPKKRYLTYSEFPLGLEAKWKSKRFDFVFGGGYVLSRNFTFKGTGIKNLFKDEPSNRLGGNIFINTGIRYRLTAATK